MRHILVYIKYNINNFTMTMRDRVRVLMFNATFNNISIISWRSVLLVGETGVPREHYRSVNDKLYRCLSFSFRLLCCLLSFDLWILITPLVSSNSCYHIMLHRVHLKTAIRTHNFSDGRHLLHW
jgi:hypothetical protein